jgi:hypothetical protein
MLEFCEWEFISWVAHDIACIRQKRDPDYGPSYAEHLKEAYDDVQSLPTWELITYLGKYLTEKLQESLSTTSESPSEKS